MFMGLKQQSTVRHLGINKASSQWSNQGRMEGKKAFMCPSIPPPITCRLCMMPFIFIYISSLPLVHVTQQLCLKLAHLSELVYDSWFHKGNGGPQHPLRIKLDFLPT